MARLNTNLEVYDRISRGGIIRDRAAGAGVGSGVLASAAAAGAVVVTVGSGEGANFGAGELVRIGSGNKLEEGRVLSVATDAITLRSPLAYDHATGEVVVEREKVVLGEVSEEGVSRSSTLNRNGLKTATTRGVYVYLLIDADHEISWSTVNHNVENIAVAHGIPESAITGAGTANSPRRLVVQDNTMLTANNQSLFFEGSRVDGTIIEIQGWDVQMNPTSEATYTSGQGTPVRISGNPRTVAIFEYSA